MSLKRHILTTVLCLAACLTAAAQYNPDHFYMRGRRALADGKYADAIASFNVLSRLDTSDYEAFFFRGVAKYDLGDYTGAEKDFDLTLKKNPIYTLGYHYRAIARSQSGKYDEALADLATAVSLRPGYTGLYFSRGVVYFMSQQFEKAVEDFDRYIRNEPEDGAAYLNRGASYLFLGDTTKALDNYNQAIKLDRYDAEVYVRRARIYALRDQFEDAIKDLDTAISLDSTNTLAYFNRGLMKYDNKDIRGALEDLDKVLRDDPGNALTLYNRALIYSQIGDFEKALDDYDRVININSENVLAYFNRASVFLEMRRYENAISDYTKAIELYPDFAKAYMNRAYARNMLGQWAASERDYETARAKIREYQQNTSTKEGYEAFADTTQSYSHLIDFDADFAKKNFDNELLQYRDVDIGLKPLYKFSLAAKTVISDLNTLSHKLQYEKLDAFYKEVPLDLALTTDKESPGDDLSSKLAAVNHEVLTGKTAGNLLAKAILETGQSQFNTAMACYNEALAKEPDNEFLYLNRGVLQADMTDFISSMDNNIRVLSLDNSATTRVTVSDNSASRTYDYSAAISDFMKAAEVAPDFPYTYYNLGNLFCLSEDMLTAISQYTKALDLYPYIPEAYYNRGLVLIFLKDKEKGCLDMSKAGELGIADAYSVIKKYCTEQQQ